jgi:hypothetical protein
MRCKAGVRLWEGEGEGDGRNEISPTATQQLKKGKLVNFDLPKPQQMPVTILMGT